MMKNLQKLGRTFMLPIALLPVAGLLLGIGASFTSDAVIQLYGLESVLNESTVLFKILSVLKDTGEVVFANLPMLFAVGVALGLAKEEKGVAALSGLVAYMVMYAAMTSTIQHFMDINELKETAGLITNVMGFENTMNTGVFGGIVIGIIVSILHNRFYTIKLPDALSFFNGTRFIPIISSIAAVIVGMLFTWLWPYAGAFIAWLGIVVSKLGYVGTFIYGFIYRSLIPLGLHHVFYLPFWQTAMGGVTEVGGVMVEGAQNIVFAQLAAGVPIDPNAARFFSGMFPFMIFGFPAAALAMYHTAFEENKSDVKGLLVSSSLTSIFTGITEPIEFSFLFASPFLYFGVHAVLAALSFTILHILQVGVGLTFSGGLIDFILYGVIPGQALTNWLPALFVGVAYGFIYYFVFRFFILKFDLKTPGREDLSHDEINTQELTGDAKFNAIADRILNGLGGKDNIKSVDYCATRLRLEVEDVSIVDDNKVKGKGVAGVMKPGANSVQVIIGPDVQFVARAFNKLIK